MISMIDKTIMTIKTNVDYDDYDRLEKSRKYKSQRRRWRRKRNKNSDANSARRLLTGHSKITMLPPIVETTINFFYSAVYYIAIFQYPLSVHLLNVTAAINSSFVL